MNTTQVAVDLAKSVFEVAVSRRPGKVCESHRLSRGRFQKFFAVREPVEVLMEACGTAHHWGRTLEAMGHRSSPDLCVKAEEAPRLRLGCLGDLLFLEE